MSLEATLPLRPASPDWPPADVERPPAACCPVARLPVHPSSCAVKHAVRPASASRKVLARAASSSVHASPLRSHQRSVLAARRRASRQRAAGLRDRRVNGEPFSLCALTGLVASTVLLITLWYPHISRSDATTRRWRLGSSESWTVLESRGCTRAKSAVHVHPASVRSSDSAFPRIRGGCARTEVRASQ
ncbi:hypothetical protein BV20DRAFT_411072 [Pilatotrama ljubarskyi]|nr:hypothetical protein BV20DRAFT_411072 [Pilatotrama ljubarskyi]